MLRLIGGLAHSSFRLERLLAQLKAVVPAVEQIHSHHEYFLQSSKALSAKEKEAVEAVLSAQFSTQEYPDALWVIPRLGTQSAWGSKALDILQNVGLTSIQHIERATVYRLVLNSALTPEMTQLILPLIHDRMTESVITHWEQANSLFVDQTPAPLTEIAIMTEGKEALIQANQHMGLALSPDEIHYLYTCYHEMQRNPTDAELMMFAQANSEHCRHKIFKASWEIDGQIKPKSLFAMIKNTYQQHPEGVLSAYHDNAAVIAGFGTQRFYADPQTHQYQFQKQSSHLLMKVETHNHPTAIEPFAGAGTGIGGEIRDEGATGRGAKPKAGLVGFTVSNLRIPGFEQPWETPAYYPERISNSLEIMLKAPIGGAAFNNEFGRPNLCGYFRTFDQTLIDDNQRYVARGYHKPIMIAGGMGNICEPHLQKQSIPEGALLIVLGGPAMKIGLGGGAASSMTAGSSLVELDFASVQRQNPEMQRRCQEVIDSCWAQGTENPIISIHDVGAGGLANALPELVHDAHKGALLQMRDIPNAEKSMSPLEIWCNESQERYVLAIHEDRLNQFASIAQRERCPFAVLGKATTQERLTVEDQHFNNKPLDLPLEVLFGNTPQLSKKITTPTKPTAPIDSNVLPVAQVISRVLQCPTVGDKSFLITIGDRTVMGLTARDQMVGPWQVPVADCAVTATNYLDSTGEAMSMGERPAIALLNAPASARMAVAEAILNLLAADIENLAQIRLSCNWMAAANYEGDEADLFAAVQAIGEQLCPTWKIVVPVGKDSLSMRTKWQTAEKEYDVVAPMSLVVSAFAAVKNIHRTLTPQLETQSPTQLLLIDLAQQQKRLGGSIFAQVTQQIGEQTPDVDDLDMMPRFVQVLNQLKVEGLILAYHDRSDGGVWTTLCEMAFASRTGLDIDLSSYAKSWQSEGISALFNEELGVVIQVPLDQLARIKALFAQAGMAEYVHEIAKPNKNQMISLTCHGELYFAQSRAALHGAWSQTSYLLQRLRDNPDCADQAYQRIINDQDPGLFVKESFIAAKPIHIHTGVKPRVAILREQGVNGHVEMAAAFTLAGFEAIDVTMSDLLAGATLKGFKGLAACGGFSYGDVLGAGKGWAKTILFQERLRDIFAEFFHQPDTFALGVCNGCQMMASIKELIPGSEHWPQFVRNVSEQFEARLSLVEICPSPSILLKDLQGAILPIVVSHGEGFTDFSQMSPHSHNHLALRYVDHHGQPTEQYPYNPNGSPQGMTGFTTTDGRVTIMMPHPERVIKAWQLSWRPAHWQGDSPWMRLFLNARNWLE